MRFFVYENGGPSEGYISLSGLEMQGPLKLKGDPVSDMEAVPRRYALEKTETLRAEDVTLDNFEHQRFPEFSGDFDYDEELGKFTLKETGVVSATHTKVTVNSKGRVVSGGSLTYGDIPELPWSKVTSGKPNTLAGFGITDALSGLGGTVIGEVRLFADPSLPNHPATVSYVKNVASGLDAVLSGQIVASPSIQTPPGYLLCNGASVRKDQYGELYSIIGDKYSLKFMGAGKPWNNQYGINTQSSDTLGAWVADSSLPIPVRFAQTVVTKNKVYIMGGVGTTTDPVSGTNVDVFRADIDSGGNIKTWTKSGELPEHIHSGFTIVMGKYVYVIGGANGSVKSNRVWGSTIAEDGHFVAWDAMPSLPLGAVAGGAFAVRNFIYVLDAESTNIYKGSISSTGLITGWEIYSVSLPKVMSRYSIAVTKDRVYLIGGVEGSQNLNSVYSCIVLPSDELLAFTPSIYQLPVKLNLSQVLVTNKNVWLFGGVVNETTTSSNRVFKSSINVDGTLTTWEEHSSLPEGRSRSILVATSHKVYLLGGWLASSSASVINAPLVGGKNDLSPYYDITNPTAVSNLFGLPDFQGIEKPVGRLFIKF